MNITINDTEEYYYQIVSLNQDTDVTALVSNFVQKFHGIAKSLDCEIRENDNFVESISLTGDYLSDLDVELGLLDKGDVTLELKCEKTEDKCLRVVNVKSFISNLAKRDQQNQLKFWLRDVKDNYTTIQVNGQTFELTRYKEHVTAESIERHKKDTVADLVGIKMNVCYFDFLLEEFYDFSSFFDHVLELRTVLCLCLISRASSLNEKTFTFDGESKLDLNLVDENFYFDQGESIYRVFQWAYTDERLSARIGIINQAIAQSKNIISVFDANIIKILDSIYQVYIKEDFEHYIEVRNRVSDATLDLCNRINEAVSSSRATIKQSIFVIVSYFFSIIVFTAIDKGKIENIFSIELAVLSSVFIVAAFLSIFIASKELDKTVKIHKYQLDEIKTRNRVFLSESEISDFFNSQSLSEAISTSESKSYLYVASGILTILAIILWVLHFTRAELVSIPVYLHIV
ncbi:hypothetical protein BIT28_14410 [Photobacterium proteolyticum]|uniref:Uncharacterized protein n=1 Tax=Photobacterium proteolyticum TaxID=1903952 RepID=A0A1Q9H1H9_9GAMM|nr:hypothetical protein [Photobacterium proteolyticum]OLQ81484.1 hypothetical protein BIT28_14410 [Photobacterium proteolyticum]